MAQSLTLHKPAGLGDFDKLKICVFTLNNTGAETSFAITPADLGLARILAIFGIGESAIAAMRVDPVRDGGLITSATLSWTTGGVEFTLVAIGF